MNCSDCDRNMTAGEPHTADCASARLQDALEKGHAFKTYAVEVECSDDEECERCGQTLNAINLDDDCVPLVNVRLTSEELATILCALRTIQDSDCNVRFTCEDHFREYDPLTNLEIDVLYKTLEAAREPPATRCDGGAGDGQVDEHPLINQPAT